MHFLRKDWPDSQIICLVRARDEQEANQRVASSLAKWKLSALTRSDKIECVPFHLSDPTLGLSKTRIEHIKRNCTSIIHVSIPSLLGESLTMILGRMGCKFHASAPLLCTRTYHWTAPSPGTRDLMRTPCKICILLQHCKCHALPFSYTRNIFRVSRRRRCTRILAEQMGSRSNLCKSRCSSVHG